MEPDPPLDVVAATRQGDAATPNEDYVASRGNVVLVLDGLTSRTGSGCVHGVQWFVSHLASEFLAGAGLDLPSALRQAIQRTADLHRETCDLTHPGTPAAAVAALRVGSTGTDYLVLADTTIVMELRSGSLKVISDARIRRSAQDQRAKADSYLIGSDEKRDELLRMKLAELKVRNTSGGYWTAAADPGVADQCLVGSVPTSDVMRVVVATDGASRLVDLFGLMSWREFVDYSFDVGPDAVVDKVRSHEERDPRGARWPRNKKSDDATLAVVAIQ